MAKRPDPTAHLRVGDVRLLSVLAMFWLIIPVALVVLIVWVAYLELREVLRFALKLLSFDRKGINR